MLMDLTKYNTERTAIAKEAVLAVPKLIKEMKLNKLFICLIGVRQAPFLAIPC